MKFNIGLDLNRNHSEMRHNAFPKAKNILLNDFGDALLTEYGHINLLSSTYTFSSGSIINKDGDTIGSGSVVFTITDCNICGYIVIEYELLLFIYDNIKKISFILKVNPSNNNYNIFVQNINNIYTTFSFASNSIIKGTHYYNYLGQLIIAFNDVSKLNLNKLVPTFWISNLNETYINENSKSLIQLLNNTQDNGILLTLSKEKSGNLKHGTYFVAYIILDSNNNESEISSFYKLSPIPFYNIEGSFSKYNNTEYDYSIECIVTNTNNYKLIIGYKSENDVNIIYYKTPLLNGSNIIYDLSLLETTNITSYIKNINIFNVNSLEQYDNKLLLGNVKVLDENYTYIESNVLKTLSNELQSISNDIFITYTIPSNPTGLNSLSNVFIGDEVYALYIEYISIRGTSLGCYHIPGRPATTDEESDAGELLNGFSETTYKGNIKSSSITNSTNDVIGTFVNKTEYYPANFPGTKLIVSAGALSIDSTRHTLAGTKIRHHKIPAGNLVYNLVARNINIPSNLRSIIKGYNIYYAKRDDINNLILNTGIIGATQLDDLLPSEKGQYYFLSFEALYNKKDINCIGYRKIGDLSYTIVSGTTPITFGTGIVSSSWENNTIYKNNKLHFIEADTIPSYMIDYALIAYYKSKQSYLWSESFGTSMPSTDYNRLCHMISHNLFNNCYQDYINQKLILSTSCLNNTTTYISLLGDSYYTRESYGMRFEDQENHGNNIDFSYFNILMPSKYNIQARYRFLEFIDTNDNRKKQCLYPYDGTLDTAIYKESLRLYDNPINNTIGQFYKTSFNGLNDLYQPIVYNFNTNFISDLPNRILRSNVNSSESIVIGWKNVTGLDYYDLPKNKGSIINILVDVKRIYVQCEYGLMLTDIKDIINQSVNVLPLDIFEYPPIELNKNNPIKSDNPFTLVNSPIGIITIDKNNKIYNINQDGISDLSLLGVENYLQPKYDINSSNQFVHIGIDINNKRILFNNGIGQVMLSYNYLNKIFVAEHDYCPKFSIQLHNNIYFIPSDITKQGLYKFDKTSVKYLGNNTNRESKFDIIYNSYPEITKLLQSIRWITKSINIDGSEDEFDTFNKLMVYNNTQCSNYIDLRTIMNSDNYQFDWFDTRRSLKIYDNFQFNNIFDMVQYTRQPFLDSNLEPISNQFPTKMWYEMSNFISNYFIIRFTYNGTNRLIINSISPELIKTAR